MVHRSLPNMASITEEFLIVVLLSYHTVKAQIEFEGPPNADVIKESQKMCEDVAVEPYFDPEMIIGKPWRINYMWKMNLENICIDLQFEMATPEIIRRIYYKTSQNLETQPPWSSAVVLLTIGRAKWELLLFKDQGPAGRFFAIPNMAREASIPEEEFKRNSPYPFFDETENSTDGSSNRPVQPLKFQMKLLKERKMLFFAECSVGVASISTREDENIPIDEIVETANPFSSICGTGYMACIVTENSLVFI